MPGDSSQRTILLWGATQGVMQLRKLGRFDANLATRELADQLYLGLFAGWGASVESLPTVQKVSHETLLQLGSPAES